MSCFAAGACPAPFRAGRGLHAVAYAALVRLSTIAKHFAGGPDTAFSRALGDEIRRRRMDLGLSQSRVGRPLTRAFMSSVECGRVVPSLPSLLLIAGRLNSTAGAILTSVETQLEDRIEDGRANNPAIPR